MFGGIAAAGAERLVYATFDGNVIGLDVESGEVTGQFTLYPCAPARVHVSVCAVDADGSVLLGDTHNRRVRRYTPDGRQVQRYGGLSNPSLEEQDDAGILDEPCAILPLRDGRLVVACGGFGAEHAVQCFDRSGGYLFSLASPPEGWKRAQGLALVDESLWVAETEAGAVRRHALDGRFLGEAELHPDLRRPFRLQPDGYGGVLMVLAPETEEEQEQFGLARLDRDGTFEGWAVRAGEKGGHVYCPFDVAVLPDGRFVVADLPLGSPPDVRLQLFSPDGRLLRTLVEDNGDLNGAQRKWFESVLERADGAETLYEQARVHHFYAGATPDHLKKAGALYGAALERQPDHLLAHLGLGALLQGGLADPGGAEKAYRAALAAGGAEGDLLARIAECRHDSGDLDGAIELLEEAIGADDPPEDYHARVEALGSYYLERAGEPPEAMI
jgi:tetratricopeptide (TPR) repeat protein